MKKDWQLHLATCPTWQKFNSPSKMQRGKLNPIPTNDRGDMLAIDVFSANASMTDTRRAKRYVLTMSALFNKFGVAAPMPEHSAQTVDDTLISRWVLLFGATPPLLTD